MVSVFAGSRSNAHVVGALLRGRKVTNPLVAHSLARSSNIVLELDILRDKTFSKHLTTDKQE